MATSAKVPNNAATAQTHILPHGSSSAKLVGKEGSTLFHHHNSVQTEKCESQMSTRSSGSQKIVAGTPPQSQDQQIDLFGPALASSWPDSEEVGFTEENFGSDFPAVLDYPSGPELSFDWGSFLQTQKDISTMALDEIINLQTVEGSFSLPGNLITTLPGSTTKPEIVEEIKKHLPALSRFNSDEIELTDKIYITLIILFVLEQRFRDERDMWSLVAQKARAWVNGYLAVEYSSAELDLTLRGKFQNLPTPATRSLREDLNAMSRGNQSPPLVRIDSVVREVLHGDGDKGPRIRHSDDVSLINTVSVTSKESSGTHSSIPTTSVKPAYAHGIMIDSDVRRTPNESIRKELPRPEYSNFKATSVALTYSGGEVYAAYLSKSSIYFYKLDAEEMSATLEPPLELPHPNGWRHIAVGGFFLAAWGFFSDGVVNLVLYRLFSLSANDLLSGCTCAISVTLNAG
jgi:hypothetical protein